MIYKSWIEILVTLEIRFWVLLVTVLSKNHIGPFCTFFAKIVQQRFFRCLLGALLVNRDIAALGINPKWDFIAKIRFEYVGSLIAPAVYLWIVCFTTKCWPLGVFIIWYVYWLIFLLILYSICVKSYSYNTVQNYF